MKRTLSILNIICLLAILVLSCKEDKLTNTPMPKGTATISGIAYVNLDARNDTDFLGGAETQYEYVPAGTQIYAITYNYNLVEYPGWASYGENILIALVGANGAYSFTVPSIDEGVQYDFYSDDFRADYIVNDTVTESYIFLLPEGSYSEYVVNGATKLLDLYFSQR